VLVAAAHTSASYYQLLQIGPEATAQELRSAFRTLSKRYHPDTTELPEQEARESFRLLQQAYVTLSDPERRRAYDAALVAVQARAIASRSLTPPAGARASQPLPVRRALSGGEWFALLLLAVAVLFSLVLGVGLAWARGAALLREPSWWPAPVLETDQIAGQTARDRPLIAPDVGSAASPGAALQPSPAGAGALAAGLGSSAAAAQLLPVGPPASGLER
jgi:DnaJ domain